MVKKIVKSNLTKVGYESEIINNVLIIRLQSNLVCIGTFDELKEYINECLKNNIKKIVINLAGIKFINCIGLGMLIDTLYKIKESNGIMYLCRIDKAEKLLTISNLNTVFLIADDEKEAIEMIQKSNSK